MFRHDCSNNIRFAQTQNHIFKAYSRNLGHRSILARNGNFYEKRALDLRAPKI